MIKDSKKHQNSRKNNFMFGVQVTLNHTQQEGRMICHSYKGERS